MFYKKSVRKNFATFTGKYLRQSLFFKKKHWRRCFPVNFAKFLRIFFSQNTCGGCFMLNFITPFYGWGSTAAKLQNHYEQLV